MSQSMHQPADSSTAATVDAEVIRARLRCLGDYVRAELNERGISVRQAAEIVGTPLSTFSRHLNSGNFYMDELHYLARDVFGVSMSGLYLAGTSRQGAPEATR